MADNAFHLDIPDAMELAEMLGFIKSFFDVADPAVTGAFTEFVGSDGYTVEELCRALERFEVLLDGGELPLAEF